MLRLLILHANDVHGRVEGLARIATLVETTRRVYPDQPVLYFDLGDSEDTTNRLSSLTKGVAMHRLLSAAGCDASVVGNATTIRYGPRIVGEQAAAARYPLLLANVREPDGSLLPGVRASAIVHAGPLRLGLIGVTSALDDGGDRGSTYERDFGMRVLPVAPLVRELAAELRREGVHAVLLLSHLGLPADRELAAELQGVVPLILGGHSHHLLPQGERVGDVMIAQAGEYAQHLGRVDLLWEGDRLLVERATVEPVPHTVTPSASVLEEARVLENEAARFLNEIVGELAEPLDLAHDRECGVGDFMADVLRERTQAEVALVTAGQAFTGPLPAGPLARLTLWEVCPSPANPTVARMTGAQLVAVVARGLDPQFARDTPRPLRGSPRGLMHLSGATVRDGRLFVGDAPVEADRVYLVGGSDWELEPDGGYTDAAWGLDASLDTSVILREAAETYLAHHRPASVRMGRVRGSLLAEGV